MNGKQKHRTEDVRVMVNGKHRRFIQVSDEVWDGDTMRRWARTVIGNTAGVDMDNVRRTIVVRRPDAPSIINFVT